MHTNLTSFHTNIATVKVEIVEAVRLEGANLLEQLAVHEAILRLRWRRRAEVATVSCVSTNMDAQNGVRVFEMFCIVRMYLEM